MREQEDEGFVRPVEARLSGPSRLLFRVPLDDYEGGRPETGPEAEPAGGFPFSFEALTNWGGFDLAVVRRAERVFEPLAAWAAEKEQARPDGLLPAGRAQRRATRRPSSSTRVSLAATRGRSATTRTALSIPTRIARRRSPSAP